MIQAIAVDRVCRVQMPSVGVIALVIAVPAVAVAAETAEVAIIVRRAPVQVIRHRIIIFSFPTGHWELILSKDRVMVGEIDQGHFHAAFGGSPIDCET